MYNYLSWPDRPIFLLSTEQHAPQARHRSRHSLHLFSPFLKATYFNNTLKQDISQHEFSVAYASLFWIIWIAGVLWVGHRHKWPGAALRDHTIPCKWLVMLRFLQVWLYAETQFHLKAKAASLFRSLRSRKHSTYSIASRFSEAALCARSEDLSSCLSRVFALRCPLPSIWLWGSPPSLAERLCLCPSPDRAGRGELSWTN